MIFGVISFNDMNKKLIMFIKCLPQLISYLYHNYYQYPMIAATFSVWTLYANVKTILVVSSRSSNIFVDISDTLVHI